MGVWSSRYEYIEVSMNIKLVDITATIDVKY